MTELASAEKEGIEGQLHHARCIQNALSDIKAEVGNLMKIGRKILDNETFERKMELKEKIDALERDYHEAGCEVSSEKDCYFLSKIAHENLFYRLFKLRESSMKLLPCLKSSKL